VRGNAGSPSEYRHIQNYVANSLTKEIIYTPPSPLDLPALMAELVAWLGADTGIHPVLVAAIAQFHLVHIHPFVDGNGRTARLLSTLCLYRSGYDFKRLFTISEYYDRHAARRSAAQGRVAHSPGCPRPQVRSVGTPEGPRGLALRQPAFGIQDLEALLPGVHRRTLQRELKELLDHGVFVTTGATRNLSYSLAK
jgi:Fic family protein